MRGRASGAGRAPRSRSSLEPHVPLGDPEGVYEFIAGTIEARSATSVVVAAAGVGYELLAPLGAPFSAPGESAKVYVHLVVREDAQTLYGFPGRDDRDLFRILLRVRGVGPSMALGVLSGMSAAEIAGAVARDDLKAFTAIKGVGKKTAEQILLDLRDKSALLASVAGEAPAAPQPHDPETTRFRNLADVITALVSIATRRRSDEEGRGRGGRGRDGRPRGLVRAAMRA